MARYTEYTDGKTHKVKERYVVGTDGLLHRVVSRWVVDASGVYRLIFDDAHIDQILIRQQFGTVGSAPGGFSVVSSSDNKQLTFTVKRQSSGYKQLLVYLGSFLPLGDVTADFDYTYVGDLTTAGNISCMYKMSSGATSPSFFYTQSNEWVHATLTGTSKSTSWSSVSLQFTIGARMASDSILVIKNLTVNGIKFGFDVSLS